MSPSPSVLTIDLAALARNYERLRAKTRARVGAAVKANAYGLGAAKVARALYDAGCRDFFVSSLAEGVELRRALNSPSAAAPPARLPLPIGERVGVRGPDNASIHVLNGFYASGADEYIRHDLIPVLGSFYEIENYKTLAAKTGRALPAFLHFNIRMNRLGLGRAETEKLLADLSMLRGIDVKGIISHFACADEKDHPLTAEQAAIFAKIARHFPDAEKSLCNSSGLFRDAGYHYDLARPGAALYGINPTPEAENPMEFVVSLQASVVRLRLVYKGATVGYGATYAFDKDTWIATLAAGYADGLFRSLGNQGALYWKNYRCPVRGRVSMDLTTVDLSSVPESERPRPGDMMEILGPHQTVDALARDAGTIGYEILTALGGRYERAYADSSTSSA